VLLALTKKQLSRAESLNPNHKTVERMICGDGRARDIIEAWRPVFQVTREAIHG